MIFFQHFLAAETGVRTVPAKGTGMAKVLHSAWMQRQLWQQRSPQGRPRRTVAEDGTSCHHRNPINIFHCTSETLANVNPNMLH